jgi:transcriptional regulator with XRE-family HTH domain
MRTVRESAMPVSFSTDGRLHLPWDDAGLWTTPAGGRAGAHAAAMSSFGGLSAWPDHAPEWPVPLPLADQEQADHVRTTANAGVLLQTARWHAGLSQQEAAARAGTSQQTLMRYETGKTQPTLPTLHRLLAACGMGLDASLVPLVDLDDGAIAQLLDREPADRLPEPYREAVRALLPLLEQAGIVVVLGDRPGARLYGAPVQLFDCEFWVDVGAIDFDRLEDALTSAGGRSFCRFGPDGPVADDVPGTVVRHWATLGRADIRFRALEDFRQVKLRASTILLDGSELSLAAPVDVVRRWHARDRDRLLLRRALMQRRRRETRRVT